MDPETTLRALQAIRNKSIRQIEQELRSSDFMQAASPELVLVVALGVKQVAINLLAEQDPAVQLARLN